MRVAAARHVTAGAIYRHQFLPEPDTGFRLDRDIRDAVSLCFCKTPDLPVGKFYVCSLLVRQGGDQCLLLGVGKNDIAGPAIKLQGKSGCCFFPPGTNFRKHVFHHLADSAIIAAVLPPRRLDDCGRHFRTRSFLGS